MTTSVVIRSPEPNDQDLVVQPQAVGADGAWRDAGEPTRLGWGHAVTRHVWGGRRLVITEATRQA